MSDLDSIKKLFQVLYPGIVKGTDEEKMKLIPVHFALTKFPILTFASAVGIAFGVNKVKALGYVMGYMHSIFKSDPAVGDTYMTAVKLGEDAEKEVRLNKADPGGHVG